MRWWAIGGRKAYHRARPGLGVCCRAAAMSGCALGVEVVCCVDEEACERPEQRTVSGKPAAPREREGQHPLAQADLGQDSLDQIGGGGRGGRLQLA
jgi:hypothetical protein